MMRLATVAAILLLPLRDCRVASSTAFPVVNAVLPPFSASAPVREVIGTAAGKDLIVAGSNDFRGDAERYVAVAGQGASASIATIRIAQDEGNEGGSTSRQGSWYAISGVHGDRYGVLFATPRESGVDVASTELPCCFRSRWLPLASDEPRGLMLQATQEGIAILDVRPGGFERPWQLAADRVLVTRASWTASTMADGRIALLSVESAEPSGARLRSYVLEPSVSRPRAFVTDSPRAQRIVSVAGRDGLVAVVGIAHDQTVWASAFDPRAPAALAVTVLSSGGKDARNLALVATDRGFTAAWTADVGGSGRQIVAGEFTAAGAPHPLIQISDGAMPVDAFSLEAVPAGVAFQWAAGGLFCERSLPLPLISATLLDYLIDLFAARDESSSPS